MGNAHSARMRFTIGVVSLLILAGSCALFETREKVYARCMKCADRAYGAKGIEVLKRGAFGCVPLPEAVTTTSQARRFYFEKAWAALPSRHEAPFGVAVTWWQEGDYERALGFFEAARERKPGDMGSVIGVVSMNRVLGRYPQAMEWAVWLEGNGGADGKKVSRYLRGRIYYEEKRYEEAEPLLKEALTMAGASGFILGKTGFTMVDCEFYLAQIAVRRGDLKGADALFRSYVKRNHDPDFADYARLVFDRGVQDQRAMYDEMEACWVRTRQ